MHSIKSFVNYGVNLRNVLNCKNNAALSIFSRNASRKIPWSKRSLQQKRSAYVMLAVPLVTFGLGTWQVYRLKWKLGLINELESRMRAAPLDLSQIDADKWSTIPEYTRLKLVGSFDYTREVRIEMRQLIEQHESKLETAEEQSAPSRARAKKHQMQKRRTLIGEQQVIAFQLESGEVVLVNRGWLPRDWPSELVTRPSGRVELLGVLRRNERASQFSQQNEVQQSQTLRPRWFLRDVDQLAEHLGTRPLFVDAVHRDPESETRTILQAKALLAGGMHQESGSSLQLEHDGAPLEPIGGQTRVQLRNEHLNYAITWYLVSILTSMLWFLRYVIP